MLGPIFAREFVTVPRREKHHAARTAILVLLWVIGLTAWQATVGFNVNPTLGEVARFGLLFFQIVCYVLLTLLLFFSALSAAGTISQEKDRRTFVLLLLTDMRDYEIVLGKMLGSLLPIFVLLSVTMPILFLSLLLGGISVEQVIQAGLVFLGTSLAAGSIGGLVALWRERTFQSLALAVLGIVLYLAIVQAMPVIASLFVSSEAVDWNDVKAWFDPFRAMRSVLEPPIGEDSGLSPAYVFFGFMILFCVMLNAFGVWKLRKWNPSGEPVMQREVPTREDEQDAESRAHAHAAPGKAREVWENPILWREIATYAYGRRPLLVKFMYFLVLGLICWFAMGELFQSGERGGFVAALGLVPVGVLSLLLLAAQSVTSITSERDGNQLDLLLATDLSPKEFVFGKIGGVLWNSKEFLLPPLILAVVYAVYGAYMPQAKIYAGESILKNSWLPLFCILGAMVVMLAFALVLGLHVSLRIESSRLAIANTLGTIFFLSIGTLISIYLIIINGGSLGNQLLSFAGFLGMGIGGFWWVLSAGRPAAALTLASVLCPLLGFYAVINILIAKPGSNESADPLIPFLAVAGSFGFTIYAMLLPLISEFDVATGRTTANEE